MLRRERRERLEVVGVRRAARPGDAAVGANSARFWMHAEFAPAAAIALNAPSKKEALYAEPMSYPNWFHGTFAPSQKASGAAAAVETSGPRNEGRFNNIAITEAE